MRFISRSLVFMAIVLLVGSIAVAQTTTGTLNGTVTTGGTGLPGVTVTVSSSALQGVRTAVTNDNGAYNFPALPPGAYTVKFELSGMKTVTKKVTITLSQTARADADLGVSAVSEAITVTASAPTTLETTEISSNFDAKTVENLPIARTITATTTLAPGVSDDGPNNQLMISGAPSYDNLYIVNGAVVNDNLRGQPEAVYIEDAVQETTVLTGNVSAEYGRFTGGVISAITKSGGNDFSGSLRDSLTNNKWTNKTDFKDPVSGVGEADHIDKINPVYEATFGGRIIRDRLWFFTAGRWAKTDSTLQTVGTNIPYDFSSDEKRYEGKLTGQITQKHSLVASYLDRKTTQTNYSFGSIVDLASLTNRELPNTLLAFNYNGVITDNFLLEGQYSQRKFSFVGGGAESTDRIYGTLIRDNATSRRGWSATFCGVCSDKKRDNEYYQVKGSYFLASKATGNHNFVGGYENFAEKRNENNEQGGSGYRVWGDFIYVGQDVFLRITPDPTGDASFIQNFPIIEYSKGSKSATKSLYANDKWDLDTHWSFNVGLRYDKNDAKDQAGATTSDDSAFSPRLGVVYDFKGDGKYRVNAGYNVYVAKLDNGVNDSTSTAGSPAYLGYAYDGPAINAPGTPTNELLPTDEVLRRVFQWFDSVGGDSNTSYLVGASVPGVNLKLEGSLKSPQMTEYSIGYGMQIGTKGYFRGDYIHRDWSNFYVSYTNLDNGKVHDDLGNTFDLTYIGNDDTGLSRKYEGFQFQASYRAMQHLNIGGNYTYSTLKGNADSETFNNATVTLSSVKNYPEYLSQSWNNPERYLPGDVRHRLTAWVSYDLPTPIGAFNFSLLERYHSGFPYYQASTISLAKIANPGYQTAPATASYYISNEALRVDDISRTDLAVNYDLPITKLKVFIQADILNLFDQQGVEYPNDASGSTINQTILNSRNSACKQGSNGPTPGARCLAFNPMTETPVLGVNYQYDPNFGKPTRSSAYQLPFTYRVSLGIRF